MAVAESTIERRSHCESIINVGRKATLAMAKALREIRDDRLFEPEFKSFETYCRHRWGWSRSRAYQIIEWAEVADSLPDEVSTNLAQPSERQARALAEVPEDLRGEVWQEAVETAPRNKRGEPKASGAHIAATAARIIPQAGETLIEDREEPEAVAEPEEPNVIGEAKEAIDDFLNEIFSGKPAYVRALLLNHIRERLDDLT